MGKLRFTGIIAVFIVVSVAWLVLGASVRVRTDSLDESLSGEMRSLWGPSSLVQATPYWTTNRGRRRDPSDWVAPAASVIRADIRHDHRNKGLLWYSTFTVDFTGRYTLAAADNVRDGSGSGMFVFELPLNVSSYNNLAVSLDGDARDVSQAEVAGGTIAMEVSRDAEHVAEIRYSTGGQDRWLYVPGRVTRTESGRNGVPPVIRGGLSELADFQLTVTTDFADIDYPKGSRSPAEPAEAHDGGMTAQWTYEHAVTSQPMGIEMPKRANAGPITARMSFFAPISLMFFFTVLFTVVVLKKIPLHPMHYLFIAAGFFAFHILMAYLADVVVIHGAFWIAAAVSVVLVASYMRLVAGMKFTLAYVSMAQLVYLIGFSYAFFWVGRTGLTVTIGAVATLFVLMQATGRVKWNEVFAAPVPPPIPGARTAIESPEGSLPPIPDTEGIGPDAEPHGRAPL